MEIIISEQNNIIKKVKALQTKKYREKYNQFVVEGVRFCKEALKSNASVASLLVNENSLDSMVIQELLAEFKMDYLVIEDKLFNRMLPTVNPQGIAAIINKPIWDMNKTLEGKTFVILDGVQDPGNLGTIIRTCLAAGVDGLFCLKGTVDLFNDKVLRSTMGGVFSLPIFQIEENIKFLELIKEKGIITAVANAKAKDYYFSVEYPEKIAIVLGNEALGPNEVKEGDLNIRIPLNSDVDSLNVAVAGGIIIYEILRQQML